MVMGRWGWIGLLAFAAAGLWLLLGSGRVFGHDIGGVGMALLVGCTWLALYGVSIGPHRDIEDGVSPGEWKAWIGAAFLLASTLYFVSHAEVFRLGDLAGSRRVATNLVLLLVAWTVLTQAMASRWKARVQQDERDHAIEARGAAWGRHALVAGVIVVAVTLGISPADRLEWATHFVIGNLLVLALMVGWLVECTAIGVMYWRDRR